MKGLILIWLQLIKSLIYKDFLNNLKIQIGFKPNYINILNNMENGSTTLTKYTIKKKSK